MTLTAVESLRRFLLHVLPASFVRIRHYGWLANRHRQEKVALCRKLLTSDSAPEASFRAPLELTATVGTGPDTFLCPVCGVGRMIIVESLPRCEETPPYPERSQVCPMINSSEPNSGGGPSTEWETAFREADREPASPG